MSEIDRQEDEVREGKGREGKTWRYYTVTRRCMLFTKLEVGTGKMFDSLAVAKGIRPCSQSRVKIFQVRADYVIHKI